MTLESIGKLREALKDCTSVSGFEPYQFDTYWITAAACDKYIDEIEREIAEKYMELPVDADGVPIHVADHMEYMGDEIVVAAITPTRAYYWIPSNGYGSEMAYKDGEKLHRFKPRTIEDVLDDLLEEWATRPTSEDVLVEKYADELRSMGVGE